MSFEQQNPYAIPNLADSPLTEDDLFCGVTIDSDGNAVLPSAGASIVGTMTSLSGTDTAIRVKGIGSGIQKIRLGGTLSGPGNVKVDASGKFVAATSDDIAAGSRVAFALTGGAADDIVPGILFGGGGETEEVGGYQECTLGTDVPSNTAKVIFVTTSGTKTGVLADGLFAGQTLRVVQAVATGTPVGTITGSFETMAGASEGTLNLGNAVGTIVDFVWTGTKWRQSSAFGGQPGSLST